MHIVCLILLILLCLSSVRLSLLIMGSLALAVMHGPVLINLGLAKLNMLPLALLDLPKILVVVF